MPFISTGTWASFEQKRWHVQDRTFSLQMRPSHILPRNFTSSRYYMKSQNFLVHGTKRVFPIPEGLRELSSDIVREVLRHQPECIHGFVAEYLETMLNVREKARDSAEIVDEVFRKGLFLDELFKKKKINVAEANAYARTIQAGWKGYSVRKKFRTYLQKRRKMIEERALKKSIKIEEFLESIGITYEEATRAACIIQSAFKQARRGKWVVNEWGEEVFAEGEDVPMRERVREGDRARGRYDRWDKKDWGDFFEMDEQGEIVYDWPRVGQLYRLQRELVMPDMEIVQFYAMRDLDGKEQYSYLKGPRKGRDPRGFPIGFLIPLPQADIREDSPKVGFVDPDNNIKMGSYGYVFAKSLEKKDLDHFAELLRERKNVSEKIETFPAEIKKEFDYDPDWVVPKILVQIRKDCLTRTDDEVAFENEELAPETDGLYTFRAENPDNSLRVIEHIMKSPCGTVEEAMADAANISEYKQRSTGRFLAVENFDKPKYIQKVIIYPETKAARYENRDMDHFEYVFVPKGYKWKKRPPAPENPIKIPLTRFQGHHSNYLGSKGLDDFIFIMGPTLHSPDGKHINHQSIFWNEFGPESWYQLLCTIANKKIARLGEEVVEEEEEEQEYFDEEEGEELEETEAEEDKSVKEPEIFETTATPVPSTMDVDEEIKQQEPEENPIEPEPQSQAEVAETPAPDTETTETLAEERKTEQDPPSPNGATEEPEDN